MLISSCIHWSEILVDDVRPVWRYTVGGLGHFSHVSLCYRVQYGLFAIEGYLVTAGAGMMRITIAVCRDIHRECDSEQKTLSHCATWNSHCSQSAVCTWLSSPRCLLRLLTLERLVVV